MSFCGFVIKLKSKTVSYLLRNGLFDKNFIIYLIMAEQATLPPAFPVG